MKSWKKKRNYHRVRDENGEVTAHIITVDGKEVEVTTDVYAAYAGADRRERYTTEDMKEEERPVSLEQLQEQHSQAGYSGTNLSPSAEEVFEKLEEQKILRTALAEMNEKDRELIEALFYDGVSTRDYAKRTGVSHTAVIKRKNQLLKVLKKIFNTNIYFLVSKSPIFRVI